MKNIALTMIVKNEGAYIERAIRSALPLVDMVVVHDTGSTDNTWEILCRLEEEITAKKTMILVQTTFKDFATARNAAIETALTNGAKWLLFMDGDEELVVSDKAKLAAFLMGDKMEPGFNIDYEGKWSFARPSLVNMNFVWRYTGKVHEYVSAPAVDLGQLTTIPWVRFRHADDAHRRVDKSARNLALLQEELKEHPNNRRATFYMGETMFELKQFEHAYEFYMRVWNNPHSWDQERFHSHYRMAMCKEILGSHAVAIALYLQAYNFRPTRIEPLYRAASILRGKSLFEAALLMLAPIVDVPMPDDKLFVERNVYEYEARFEYGAVLIATKRYTQAKKVLQGLRADNKVPAHVKALVDLNLKTIIDLGV